MTASQLLTGVIRETVGDVVSVPTHSLFDSGLAAVGFFERVMAQIVTEGLFAIIRTGLETDIPVWHGLVMVGLIGMVSDGSTDSRSKLAAKIERLKSGSYDVNFDDVDDEFTEVRNALDGLAEELQRQTQESEQYTTGILNALDDLFYVLDQDGTLLRWNETFQDVTGYTETELDGMNALEMFPQSEQEHVATAIARVFEAGTNRVEARFQTKDGTEIPYEFQATTAQRPDGITVLAGIGRDISEQQAHKRKLEERERELSTLMDNIPGMVYRAKNEPDWPMEFVSDGCRGVTGYDPDTLEMGEVNWGQDVIADDNDELWETVQQALENSEPFQTTYQIERADGEVRWVWEQGRGIFEDGTLQALEGVIFDITERKRAEQELEQTRQMLEQAQRIAGVGGWNIDLSVERPYKGDWTEEFADILGISPDAPLNLQEGLDFFHPDDKERVRTAVTETIESEGSYDIEARLVTADGELRWVRSSGEFVETDDGPRLRGALQDITEQKQRESELERTKDLLEETQRIANVGGWELDVSGDPPYEGTFTDELYRIHELSRDETIEMDEGLEYYHPEDRDAVQADVERAITEGEQYEREARFISSDGTHRWVRTTGVPIYEDGEVVKLRGALQDITDQKERELALETLQQTSRELLGTETDSEVAQQVIDRTKDVLGTVGTAVYLLDDETNRLEPVAVSEGFSDLCEPAVVSLDQNELWECFVTGEHITIDSESQVFGSHVEHGLVVPMDEYGVFVLTTDDDAIDSNTQWLAETFAATAEAALDRLDSEATLRDREDELETQNQRLKQQVQINTIIRSVHQSLIGADSVPEIEQAVCDRLVESEQISFAWIGSTDSPEGEIEPRSWAGTGKEYLEEIPHTPTETGEPAVVTAETGDLTVIENVIDDLDSAEWRRSALVQDFHSVLSVPLSFDGRTVGVLTVYGEAPKTVTDLEATVFAELGESIAHSIIATTTRQALHADTQTELSLRVSCDSFFTWLAETLDCHVEYRGLAAHDEETARLFVTITGTDPETVLEALSNRIAVTSARLVADGEEALFEVVLEEESVPVRLLRHGGNPRSIRTTEGGLDVVVDVATTTDVREFIDMLETEYSAVELLGRRTVERSIETHQEYRTSLLEDLTDRQLEVLRTAYYAGFFESPRTSTGEDIAEMLDVTQPTVNRHLRLAQQHLLGELFDGRGPDTESTSPSE
jgi:PAS domain S-box-containing protein